jgi:site-specific DNA recombinase
VPASLYDPVQQLLEANRRKAKGSTSAGSGHMLSGLVQDASGQRMTATHTGKANRRYCYYASPATRVPASDLDALVLTALQETLASPAKLAVALPSLDIVSPTVIAASVALAKVLTANASDIKYKAVRDLVDQVEVTEAGVTTIFRLDALGLAGEIGTIVTPASLGRAKARLTLVVPGHAAPNPDTSLIAVVAQARGWLADLTSGNHISIRAIASAHGITSAYIRQFIGTAFLAPDLVTRIVEGRQPTWLTVARLSDMLPLPADWSAQRSLFAMQN